ncbi:hypothetical protein AAFC00_005190 [Neodothiora populina]|uniref:Autophagy-related protein 1 n=1 Tax=Neodothiora populina TaxID=2781224 RepID=A0ABR3PK31_9PEZI
MDCMKSDFTEHLLDDRFQTISPLNHGSFGMVFMGVDIKTGQKVAIKCLTKASATDCPASISIDDFSEELAIHSKIGHHDHIVNLIHTFETEHHQYLILEFCPNGDLYEAIRLNRGPLETEHVRDFMYQLVDAVQFLHSKNIYHRDIKPENIFLSASGDMKLGDFGLATMAPWSTEFAVGSDRYMAPEQFQPVPGDYGYDPAKADIWAIGICLLNVLFSRNPFAEPTCRDPLFDDFTRDRQSLFDVFPNMSQDTYNVLVHALAMDPQKRDLSKLREALDRVVSFTTDDESLDEFCTEDRDPVPATLNREPLRTPSITSPTIDNGGCFPWAKALRATSQKHSRQLSVIPDNESYTEDLFPDAKDTGRSWFDTDSTSLNSTVDSSLSMSYKSANNSSDYISHASSRPVPISSSVPAKSSKPMAMASVYRNTEICSKSWSDLFEEDEEEEEQRTSFEDGIEIERASTAKPREPSPLSAVTAAIDIDASSQRSSTPRSGLVELTSTHIRGNISDMSRRKFFGQSKGPVAASAPIQQQKYSPPSKRSLVDKWAALGNIRRGNKSQPEVPATPQKIAEKHDSFTTPLTNPAKKTRERAGSWRKGNSPAPHYQHSNHSGVKGTPTSHFPSNDLWQTSRDWRQHPTIYHDVSPISKTRAQPVPFGQQLPRSNKHYADIMDHDDIGDLEWVGGWDALHL